MDVTKLFEISNDKLEPLPFARLETLIEAALAQPQISAAKTLVPANQNSQRFKRALAVAAALALVIAVSFQLSPPINTAVPTAAAGDAYDEVSEILMLETLDDLS